MLSNERSVRDPLSFLPKRHSRFVMIQEPHGTPSDPNNHSPQTIVLRRRS
jgi:hypothetical protein